MEEQKTKTKKEKSSNGTMLVVIRIAGEVKVKPQVRYTLDILRLRRKYSCILIDSSNKSLWGMLNKVKFSVAYGNIDSDTLSALLKARGQKIDGKKFNPDEVAMEIINGKKLDELGFKPFFRLHPPRKGIDSKIQYPKGVLGNNKEDINKLVMRML
jgi:large subunit ribosomal protein L30